MTAHTIALQRFNGSIFAGVFACAASNFARFFRASAEAGLICNAALNSSIASEVRPINTRAAPGCYARRQNWELSGAPPCNDLWPLGPGRFEPRRCPGYCEPRQKRDRSATLARNGLLPLEFALSGGR